MRLKAHSMADGTTPCLLIRQPESCSAGGVFLLAAGHGPQSNASGNSGPEPSQRQFVSVHSRLAVQSLKISSRITASTPAVMFGNTDNGSRTGRKAAHRGLLEPDAVKAARPVLSCQVSNSLGLPAWFPIPTRLRQFPLTRIILCSPYLVPMMQWAQDAGLHALTDEWMKILTGREQTQG